MVINCKLQKQPMVSLEFVESGALSMALSPGSATLTRMLICCGEPAVAECILLLIPFTLTVGSTLLLKLFCTL